MKILATIIVVLFFLGLLGKIADHDIEIKTLKNEVNDLHVRIEELEFKDTDEFIPCSQYWRHCFGNATNNLIKQ